MKLNWLPARQFLRSRKQDIYAKIMMMSLCAGLAFPIEEKVKQTLAVFDKEVESTYKKGLLILTTWVFSRYF